MNKKIIEEVKLAEEGTIMAEFQKERTDAITEMFDYVGGDGIYPTSKFFIRLDNALEKALAQQKEDLKEEVEKIMINTLSADTLKYHKEVNKMYKELEKL